jgi:hypothetical protein
MGCYAGRWNGCCEYENVKHQIGSADMWIGSGSFFASRKLNETVIS